MRKFEIFLNAALVVLIFGVPYAFSDQFLRGIDRQQAYYERQQLIKCQEGYQRYCQMILARQEATQR